MPPNSPPTFSDLRRRCRFTQEALSGASGVAVETIGKIERGTTRNPRPDILQKLSRALCVSIDDLMQIISGTQTVILTNESRNDYNIKYKICESIFLKLSKINARCDIDIFNALFLDFPHDIQSKVVVVRACITAVRLNMTNTLDAVVDLFKAMTGEQYAACVQMLVPSDFDGSVKTMLRDSVSSKDRTTGRQTPISGNTINERIYTKDYPYVIIDDLKGEVISCSIKTTSTNAGLLYNSVVIVPIPDLQSDNEDENPKAVAALCIDSLNPLREDRKSVCLHFAQELAFRLGVMNYRLDKLVVRYNELRRRSNQGG